MLKLNYTEGGLFLEQVMAPVDAIATQRVMLAMSIGESLYVEPSRATFLLSATAPGYRQLQRILQRELTNEVEIAPIDSNFVEISLTGIWMATSAQAETGTFITTLSFSSEALIYQLWQATQRQAVYSR